MYANNFFYQSEKEKYSNFKIIFVETQTSEYNRDILNSFSTLLQR